MKLVWQRFKFLSISFLTLIVFVPILVLAIDNQSEGFQINPYQFKILDLTPIGVGRVCVTNNSGISYFIPTRTYPEWSSFASAAIARLSISISAGCCGDSVCNGSETCSNCASDCGSCATCTGFYYTGWSQCDGSVQTRAVITGSPAGCVGGSPVTSQACSCTVAGCIDSSATCRNGNIFYSSSACSGGNNPITNACIAPSTPNYSCIVAGSTTSFIYTPSSGCSYTVACLTHGPGCTAGNTCRDTKVYLNNSVCGGTKYGGGIQYNCMATSVPDGCNYYSADVSVTYTTVADANCSH